MPIYALKDWYTIMSYHTTKGKSDCIITHHLRQFYNTITRLVHEALYVSQYRLIYNAFPNAPSYMARYKQAYKSLAYPQAYKSLAYPQSYPQAYKITYFSWPTRKRVFNMMSNPASSTFLQNATSSEHMSTNSIPSFPRIR